MNAYRVKPMKFPWTAVVYLVAVLLALALHRMKPLDIASEWQMPLEAVGILSATAGIWLVGWGYAKLLRYRTALLSSSPTTHLVTSGPYRYTRNPVYLGYTLPRRIELGPSHVRRRVNDLPLQVREIYNVEVDYS